MPTATWNGAVLASSDDCIVVEDNQYFPPDSLHWEFFKPSDHTSVCGWKGTARYYDIEVKGQRNANAAWYYPETMPAADNIRGRLAFWNGVEVG